MKLLDAIKSLEGVELNSHKPLYALCRDEFKSYRRVGPAIKKLIDSGAITEERIESRYEVVKITYKIN